MSDAPLCLCKTPWLHSCPEHVECKTNPYARVRMLAFALLESEQLRAKDVVRLRSSVATIERIQREVDNSEEDGDSLDYVSSWCAEALQAIGEIPLTSADARRG